MISRASFCLFPKFSTRASEMRNGPPTRIKKRTLQQKVRATLDASETSRSPASRKCEAGRHKQ